jgi:hypothetical protein
MTLLTRFQLLSVLLLMSQPCMGDVKFNALKDFGFGGTASNVNLAVVIVGSAVVDAEFRTESVVWNSRTASPIVLFTDGLGGAAVSVNNNGVIVGLRNFPVGAGSDPVAWIDGVPVDLPTLGEGGFASDVNDAGQIVGRVMVGNGSLPALWTNGELKVLPLPSFGVAGDVLLGSADRINSSGEIIGSVRVAFGSDSIALRWSNEQVRTVTFSTWQETRGLGISDSGTVLINGYLDENGPFSLATLSAVSVATPLAAPPASLGVWGTDFSANGIATGYSLESFDGVSKLRAAAWKDGSLQYLELPAGAAWALPGGVGTEGTIAGSASDGVSGTSVPGYWQLSLETVDVIPVTGSPEQEVTLAATVKLGAGPVAGQSVQFRVAGVNVGSATTDRSGNAKLTYKVPQTVKMGIHNLAAVAAKGAEDNAAITIDRTTTRLTVAALNAVPGQTVQVSGTLVNSNGLTALPNQSVSFQFVGRTYTGRTNARGVYSIPLTVPRTQRKGTQVPLDLRFAGSATLKPATARHLIVVR